MYAKLNPLTMHLPESSQLSDGRWVSNYGLLPDAVLKAEGWLPCDEVKPECTAAQHLEQDSAIEQNGRIVVTYRAVNNPVDDSEALLAELEALYE